MGSQPLKIAVFFTGGTIGMRHQPNGAALPSLHPADLLSDLVAQLPLGFSILPISWANLPSPHMTPEHMFKLAVDVQSTLAQPDIAGAIITHGTDAMEETAFMLDSIIHSPKPVVITGAMRPYGESGYDGVRNLECALKVCTLPLPPQLGVLLLMADKLYLAREASKVHSFGIDAFDAPEAGPVGVCTPDGVHFFRAPAPRVPLIAQGIETRVDLITMPPGMDGRFITCSYESGSKGIVLECLGTGNVPPPALDAIKAYIDIGLPIVVTSRCFQGGVSPIYGYTGSAHELQGMGAILGGRLSGNKARILLMLILADTLCSGQSAQGSHSSGLLQHVQKAFNAFLL